MAKKYKKEDLSQFNVSGYLDFLDPNKNPNLTQEFNQAWNKSTDVTPATPVNTVTPPPPPPPPTPPNPWITTSTYQAPRGIKQAQPDIVIDPEIDTTGDYIVERFFEELGGQELINLSRHDLIDGINVVYNPIANLSRLRQRFNPNNIIESDFRSQNEARNATIDIISRGMYEPVFDDQGRLVVEIDIMRPEEKDRKSVV